MAAGNRKNNQDDKWVYASTVMHACSTAKRHPQAYIPIRDILTREHCDGNNPFTREMALYLEDVETELAKNGKRNKAPIVDFSIGLSKRRSRRIRLVEAKFDVGNLKNIESANVFDKVQHATEVLRDAGVQIESGAIVLINNSPIVQQQKRWLEQRLLPRGHFNVITVNEFHKQYFFYTPNVRKSK